MQQDNKPDNQHMNSMGKPAPARRQKREEPAAQEFINEENNSAPASTAERGSQPKVKVEHS